MKGHTSKERLKRKAMLAGREYRKAMLAGREYRMSKWFKPTSENVAWLDQEVAISKRPGHSNRHVMINPKTCEIALARREV